MQRWIASQYSKQLFSNWSPLIIGGWQLGQNTLQICNLRKFWPLRRTNDLFSVSILNRHSTAHPSTTGLPSLGLRTVGEATCGHWSLPFRLGTNNSGLPTERIMALLKTPRKAIQFLAHLPMKPSASTEASLPCLGGPVPQNPCCAKKTKAKTCC